MSLLGPSRPGKHIKITRRVKTTMADYLLGGDAGIKHGTRGAVVSTGWNTLEARSTTACGVA